MRFRRNDAALFCSGSRQRHDLRAGQSRVFDCKSACQNPRRLRRESRVDGAVLPGSEFLGATIGFSEVSADFDASDFQRRRAGIRQRHGHCGAGRPLGDVAEIEARGRQRDHRFVQQYTGGTYVAADRRSIGRRQIQTTVFVEISGRDSPWQCACSQYLLGWKRAVALA